MKRSISKLVWPLALMAIAMGGVIHGLRSRPAPAAAETAKATAAAGTVSPDDRDAARPAPEALARRQALWAGFERRPFSVVQENAAFGWTAEDGRQADNLRKLAHNELELQRMAEENDRIFRRQLVYHKDTVAAQLERNKLTGQPVRQLMLPGLDGQEVRFEITATDLGSSGQQGTFAGRVAGRPDSMVTLAFKGGREAFTILSPADNLYLVGEPREPGQLIVKQINPETYVPGVCGNP